MCPRWRSATGLLTLVIVVSLLAVGLLIMRRTLWWGVALLFVDSALVIGAAAVHDHRHRAHREPTHALWGADDRNKPSFLR